MRRPILLALIAAIAGALTISAVTLAGGSDDTAKRDRGWAAYMDTRDKDRTHGGYLGSLAGRLDVSTTELRRALKVTARKQLRRAAQAGLINARERRALGACMRRHGRACDRRTLGRAAKRLKGTLMGAGGAAMLPELKRTASADLAAALGQPVDEVLAAVRAELVARLDQGVGIGVVTEKGRELALACFDDPASCDVAALRRELRFG
jgi:hypothetical protein